MGHLDADSATVLATLSANSLFCAGILVFFELSRGQRDVYAPRLRNNKYRTPGRPPSGLFQWIPHTLSVSEEDTLAMVGMDAYIVLRFVKVCAILAVVAAGGAIIMMPIYASSEHQDNVAGVNLYTMANLPQGGHKLWCSVVFSWVFSLTFIYLMHEEYEYFVYLRQKFMTDGDPDMSTQSLLTVKVENIPPSHRSSEKLYFLFYELFPNEVHSARCAQEIGCLGTLVAARDSIIARLEVTLAFEKQNVAQLEKCRAKGQPAKELSINLVTGSPIMIYGGVPYSKAIQYFCSKLAALNKDIMQMHEIALASDEQRPGYDPDTMSPLASTRSSPIDSLGVRNIMTPLLSATDMVNHLIAGSEEAESHSARMKLPENVVPPDMDTIKVVQENHDYSSTGFVTFNSRRAHALAYQVSMLSNRFPDLIATQAVEPSDVLWQNITVPDTWNVVAQELTSMMYKSGLIFWTGVLAFIAALSNLDNIADYLPIVNAMNPVLYAFVAGLLPVVVMNLFLDYIPVIMSWVSIYFEKLKSKSAVSHQVFTWFFFYSLANIYLLLITGSVFNSLADALDDPKSIFYLLGAALPSISLFFTNYLITTVLFGVPFMLLQPFPQLMMFYYDFIGNATDTVTRRQLLGENGPLADIPFDYGSTLPTILYVLCIVMTYWTLAPIIAILGAFYFIGLYVVYKFKFFYVHTREFETGGTFFYGLFDNGMFCLVVSSFLITAYVSIKEGFIQASCLFPLSFVNYYCWCHISDKFKHRSSNMAYNCASSGDLNDPEISPKATGAMIEKLDDEAYLQPELRSDVTEAMPYPHRINNIPLLGRAKANEAFASTEEAKSASGLSKLVGTVAGAVTGEPMYIAINSAYYDEIEITHDMIEEFYIRMEDNYFNDTTAAVSQRSHNAANSDKTSEMRERDQNSFHGAI